MNISYVFQTKTIWLFNHTKLYVSKYSKPIIAAIAIFTALASIYYFYQHKTCKKYFDRIKKDLPLENRDLAGEKLKLSENRLKFLREESYLDEEAILEEGDFQTSTGQQEQQNLTETFETDEAYARSVQEEFDQVDFLFNRKKETEQFASLEIFKTNSDQRYATLLQKQFDFEEWELTFNQEKTEWEEALSIIKIQIMSDTKYTSKLHAFTSWSNKKNQEFKKWKADFKYLDDEYDILLQQKQAKFEDWILQQNENIEMKKLNAQIFASENSICQIENKTDRDDTIQIDNNKENSLEKDLFNDGYFCHLFDDQNELVDSSYSLYEPNYNKKIKQRYLDDVQLELERLRDKKVLTLYKETEFDQILGIIEKDKCDHDPKGNQEDVKLIIGRALEIKQIHQKDYDVFMHAQAANWIIVSCLIKELTKVFFPEKEKSIGSFKFLRSLHVPNDLVLEDYKIYASLDNIQSTQKLDVVLNDHDRYLREGLLSVDVSLSNFVEGESVLNFLSKNYSVLTNVYDARKKKYVFKVMGKVITDIFHQFDSTIDSTNFTETLMDSCDRIKKATGNLFVICIPKSLSSTVQYRAHPYGKICDCHDEQDDAKILHDLQNDKIDHAVKCKNNDIPQYRLMTSILKPENNVKTFLLTSFTKDEKKALKNEIKQTALNFRQMTQLTT